MKIHNFSYRASESIMNERKEGKERLKNKNVIPNLNNIFKTI